jgi:hypothetical protein
MASSSTSSGASPDWIFVRPDRPNPLWFLYQWILQSEGFSGYLRENLPAEGEGEAALVDRMIREQLEFFVEYAHASGDNVETGHVDFMRTKVFHVVTSPFLTERDEEPPAQSRLVFPINDNEQPVVLAPASVRAIPTSVLLLATCVDSVVRQAPETWALGRNFASFKRNFGHRAALNLFEFWDIKESMEDDCEQFCTAEELWMIMVDNFFYVRGPSTEDRTAYVHPEWRATRVVANFVRGMAQTAKQENPNAIDCLVARYKIEEGLYCQVPEYAFPALIAAVYSKLGQSIDLFRKTRDNFI